jgi:hypothetical protein
MFLPARKYTVVLAVIAGFVAIPAAVLRLISWTWGTSWELADIWGTIQWASIFALALTLPVSCVWMIIALVKKQWKALVILVAALMIPVLAWIAGALTNFKILDSG